MEHDIIISLIFYIFGCFYIFFGVYTLISNAKSYINWRFLLLTLSMATWAFAYSFSISAPTAEADTFWVSFSVFGWGLFFGFFLHFVLVLTKADARLNKSALYILLYLPGVISIIMFAPFGYFSEVQSALMPSSSGLKDFLFANIGQIWSALYSGSFTVASVILLIRWWKKIEDDSPLRRYVTYFMLSITIPFFVGAITGVFLHFLGLTQMHKLAILFWIFPAILLFVTLRKFGVLLEKPRKEFSPLISEAVQEERRLRLFQTAGALILIGAAGSFFAGYYVEGGLFIREFSVAFAVWVLGMFLLFLPYAVKKHVIQDVSFLIICLAILVFFVIENLNIGAATVWVLYIVFLLFSIVLDNRVLALVFVIATLITQIVLWIFLPDVSATIDGSQYLTRIIIIILSYLAVVYLTSEYASKMHGYQSFSKEQETLEKISTSFISVNTENVKEKIDEMFEASAEAIGFDQGYLIGFSADYEYATIDNAYARDRAAESLPFSRGMKVKTAALPMAEAVIAQKHPVGCPDITDLSVDESEEKRNFFKSRGILSYYAVPVMVENKVIRMLVMEGRHKVDLRFRHNQKYFSKVVANILGNTKKKFLYEKKLYDYAYFDKSTKLANRNMLRKKITQLLHNRKESDKLAIFDIELDNLRVINASFGHKVGEKVAVKSASILESLMKDGCTLYRVAEGKFIIVMPVAETDEQINACARMIVDTFSEPIWPKNGIEVLFVTPVIGIAVYPYDGKDTDTLLQNADLAGYEAKSSDNKIVCYSCHQLKNRITENTLLTNKLFKSLQNEEFFLEFQPQISCHTKKTVGAEALLRWTPEDNKRIPPDIFIPILEQTGLIHEVGLWVLEQTLREHNRLVAKGFPPLRFSVNLSIAQLQKEGFVPEVLKLIETSRVNPKYIELEITESLLSESSRDAVERLSKLKDSGISIAIDDFGKGYSSLHRLDLMPFNRIKIDKCVVDDVTLEQKRMIIAKTIVSLAKALRADVTAEGVETKEQADFMSEIGCDEIQGYYYSRPLPSEALEEFLFLSL